MAKKKRTYRRRYYKKTRKRRPKTIPILPLLGTFGPMIAIGKDAYDKGWGITGIVDQELQAYTGFSITLHDFDASRMLRGLAPALIGALAHKAMNMLGVNRAFANLPSPLNKLRL